MDEGAWWATVHEVAKSQTRLSDFTFFPPTAFNLKCLINRPQTILSKMLAAMNWQKSKERSKKSWTASPQWKPVSQFPLHLTFLERLTQMHKGLGSYPQSC